MMGFHYISTLALVIFSIALMRKIQLSRRKGIKSNHMVSGQKPRQTKIAEALVVSTNYPLIFLWFFIVIRLVQVEPWFSILWLFWIGSVLSFLGAVVYAVAIKTLGDSWRVGIEQSTVVPFVNQGVYRFSRHPAYLGFFLMYLGIFLVYPTWWILLLVITSMFALINLASVEERYLRTHYPNQYEQYQQSVGFSLPKWGKSNAN